MSSLYDPAYLSDFYDRYGGEEWLRLMRSASARINYEVHLHILRKYLRSDQEILEIGPGPGRFTIPMAQAGANLTLLDISREQLRLNEEKTLSAGIDQRVIARHQGDIVDLSRFGNETFDLVTAYGGPLSYVYDAAPKALQEMVRVTKHGGYVLFSVMCKWGSTRMLLSPILSLIPIHGIDTIEETLFKGDIHDQLGSAHRFHMYSAKELKALLAMSRCETVELSASGVIANQNEEVLEGKWCDAAFWKRFIMWEIEASRQPGLLDAGSHIIAALRKP